MAILRHTLPDGSAHHDLLLAGGVVADEARAVPTWRCRSDPMALGPGESTTAEALPPHRGLYLGLRESRTLDGDRGTVHPVHAGWHFSKDGLLWLATQRLPARAFLLQHGVLRRATPSVT